MIAGIWSGHDASFATMRDDGQLITHCEIERHAREKEIAADSLEWLSRSEDLKQIDAYATCWSTAAVKKSYRYAEIASKRLHVIGHHEAHACEARFNSKFDSCSALIIDGGGYDDADGHTIATSIWSSPDGNSLSPVLKIPENELNIGGVWTRATRYVFRLESGWPQGHQAGSVMAMAAMGDPRKYKERFALAFTRDRAKAQLTPTGHIKGMSAKDPRSPKHPYFSDLEALAASSTQEMYDLAAGLQAATEDLVFKLFERSVQVSRNVCLAGGVALNSVMIGKLVEKYPQAAIYVSAVPYDAGLCIGAAKHMIHVADRVPWEKPRSWNVPYRGGQYTDGSQACTENLVSLAAELGLAVKQAGDDDVIKRLMNGEIVGVFAGRSESGRRALGHRSILADPRQASMKQIVNDRVKHRQAYRPFAPSVLRECVTEWFTVDCDSPYMSFVLRFKQDKVKMVPAVVHSDGTARLQTLTADDNGWYYQFVRSWRDVSGVPMILNTSFNDREPICETPRHALTCFKNTDIDAVYFVDQQVVVIKPENARE